MPNILSRIASLLLRRGRKNSNPDIEKLLAKAYVQEFNWKTAHLHRQLIEACRSGDTATARSLLEAGANPNWHGYEEHTPLVIAARDCDVDLLKVLLDYGADPNQKKGQQSPLAYSVFNQTVAGDVQAAACQLLINAGAKPELRCGSDKNLLYHVRKAETVRVLVAAGVDVNANKSADGTYKPSYTPSPLDSGITWGNEEVIMALIECGAYLSKGNATFVGAAGLSKHCNDKVRSLLNTPIHEASIAGDTAAVAAQLSRGVSPNTPNRLGLFALDLAQSAEIVELLVDHGADVNYVHSDGNTALHHLTSYESVLKAIELGADVFAVNNEGRTPDQAQVCSIASAWAIDQAKRRSALIITAQRKADLASIAKHGHAQEPLRPAM